MKLKLYLFKFNPSLYQLTDIEFLKHQRQGPASSLSPFFSCTEDDFAGKDFLNDSFVASENWQEFCASDESRRSSAGVCHSLLDERKNSHNLSEVGGRKQSVPTIKVNEASPGKSCMKVFV